MSVFLGIDTSNYTTSASLVEDGKVIANIKRPVQVKEGQRGVRQSDAVFSHVKNLPDVIAMLGNVSPLAVGVSSRPRDVEGSYMPCFLTGVAVARSVASLNGVGCYLFSHQAGHVEAALYSSGKRELKGSRFLAFHVSGGTTELLLCKNGNITKIGATLDLNAGQLIDRTGVLLGIDFPCGSELEKLCDFNTPFSASACVNGLDCNLSGLENKVSAMLKDGVEKSAVATFVIRSISKTLEIMTDNALEIYDRNGDLPVVFSGGVMSNRYINKRITSKYNAFFAAPEFSADNACGIALLCEEKYNAEQK